MAEHEQTTAAPQPRQAPVWPYSMLSVNANNVINGSMPPMTSRGLIAFLGDILQWEKFNASQIKDVKLAIDQLGADSGQGGTIGPQLAKIQQQLDELTALIQKLQQGLPAKPALARLVISKEVPTMGQFTVSDDKTPLKLKVSGQDAAGNAVAITGQVAWSTSNPELLTLAPSADGATCDVASVGTLPPEGTSLQVVATDTETGGSFTGTADILVAVGPLASLQISAAS